MVAKIAFRHVHDNGREVSALALEASGPAVCIAGSGCGSGEGSEVYRSSSDPWCEGTATAEGGGQLWLLLGGRHSIVTAWNFIICLQHRCRLLGSLVAKPGVFTTVTRAA